MNSSDSENKQRKEEERLQDADFAALDEERLDEESLPLSESSGEPIAEGSNGDTDANSSEQDSGASSARTRDRSNERRSEGSDDYREKYLRALAELENYKKRALKDRADLLKYQGERVLYDLLEVMDNLELALKHAEANPEKLKQGVELIHKQFADVLKRWDVKSESALGKEFNPAHFSAISRVPVHDAAPGTVIGELKKAYYYKDRLLRAGEVVVADAAEVNQSENDSVEAEDKEVGTQGDDNDQDD